MNLLQLRDDPRVTTRNASTVDPDGTCVVYWMQRAQRALDNPALEVAIAAANVLQRPLVVFLGVIPSYPRANLRHYAFLAQGIPEIDQALRERHLGFVFRPWPDHRLLRFCHEVRPSLVVGDENPMREPEGWRRQIADALTVPLWTVDADVIVPSTLLRKEQYSARVMRPRLHAFLDAFLRPPGNAPVKVSWQAPEGLWSAPADTDFLSSFSLDRTVSAVSGLKGGTAQGLQTLQGFLRARLDGYAQRRNHPDQDGTSRLSPYLHFGHLGPHTVALAVQGADAPAEDRRAFLEEMIVRRELAINFVRYNPHYESIACAEPWARRSLQEHATDYRTYLYTPQQLEDAQTHDPLWNAAQRQMMTGGWMHGYVRMYWAKKILEWSSSAAEAYAVAVHLNDRYELDGRDPNGYAGIAWAIVGKHDRAWGPERPVYGKVRYMSFDSTSRKFDYRAYIARVAATT